MTLFLQPEDEKLYLNYKQNYAAAFGAYFIGLGALFYGKKKNP